MPDRLAYSLAKLRDQVTAAYPGRKTDSDGWIASAAHHQANPSSDHESDSRGIVHAVDFTHDPERGFDSYKFADWLFANKDPRIKYVISNRRIGGDEGYAKRNGHKAWTWYTYNGENPHTGHVHVSCNKENEDDASDWLLPEAPIDFVAEGDGRGSWYSQFDGQYRWVDTGDRPNSNALGVPDHKQGFAMYDHATLGKWRNIKAPNGVVLRLQQTDIGPQPDTGRKIDIAAVAAEHFGYSPKNFPTDSIFQWSAIVGAAASVVADGVLRRETHTFSPAVQQVQKQLGFSEQEQDGYFGTETEKAVRWFQRRNGLEPDGEVGPLTLAKLEGGDDIPPAGQVDVTKLITEIWETLKPIVDRMTTKNQSVSKPVANEPSEPLAIVPVKPGWLSKINWTAIGSSVASLLTTNALGLEPEMQAQILLGVNVATNILTIVLRTWFSGTVNEASLPSQKVGM